MGRTKNELVYFIWNCAMDAAISTQDIKSACAKLLASLTRSIGSFISNYVIVRDPKRNNIRVSIEKRVNRMLMTIYQHTRFQHTMLCVLGQVTCITSISNYYIDGVHINLKKKIGGYLHARDDLSFGVDMKFIQWCGVLQRIAFVYCVVALIETFTTKLRPTSLSPGNLSIFTSYKWQWFGGFVAFVIYMVTTLSLYVPDWSFVDYNSSKPKRYTVICGMRGHLGPACNAVGYVDRQIWGVNHLYLNPVLRRLKACTFSSPAYGPLRKEAPTWCRAPFEPEGLLSSISAILSSTIGIHYGHVLIHFKLHSERLKQWLSMGFVLLLLGITLHFTNAIPFNKQLYSFSFVCVTSGAAGIVFSVLYILIDVWGLRTPVLFLEWIGMNAMLVFVVGAQGIFAAFVNGWYYNDPNNSIVNWIQNHVFINVWHSERLGTLLYVIFAEITFWGVVAGILHKLGIYWKL